MAELKIRQFWSNRDWNVRIQGKYTFCGVLTDYYEQVSRYWKNETTNDNYITDYNQFLLEFVNNKPLEDYSIFDFENALEGVRDKLRKSGRAFNDDRIRHFKVLIRRVTSVAQNAGICEDVLWGTTFKKDTKTANRKKNERVRRSLTEKEELLASDYLLSNPNEDGELLGLALMFCLGLRDNEAAALLFGDIRPLNENPDVFVAKIYKSKLEDSTDDKLSGKTKNANRYIPIPEKLVKLLKQRREIIRDSIIFEGSDQVDENEVNEQIDEMYIACKGLDFSSGCTTIDLTKASHKLFRNIMKMEEDLVVAADEERLHYNSEISGYIHNKESDNEAKEVYNEIVEKEPTAYLLRRNFATRLYHVGLTEPEIQYIMGHDIVDNKENRAYFRNEEKLVPIARKMSKRFAVNEILKVKEIGPITKPITHIYDETAIRINKLKVSSRIIVNCNEAMNGLRIKASSDKNGTNAVIMQRPSVIQQKSAVNMQNVMKKRYESAKNKLHNSSEKISNEKQK